MASTKSTRSLVCAAATAFALAACSSGNTGSTYTPQSYPQAQGQREAASSISALNPDATTTPIFGGGATFPAFAYNGAVQPPAAPATGSIFSIYGGAAIKYCLTGSGYGRTVFTNNQSTTDTAEGTCAALGASPTGFGGASRHPDLVGSDAALASTDYATYTTNEKATFGEPYEAPSIGGPIVIAYKQGDLPGLGTARLKLSAASVCGITSGTITNWDAAQITADNGKSVSNGKSIPITFYFRSDGSGTTFLLQSHLNATCPAGSFWDPKNHLATTTWLGPQPASQGESGNPGVKLAVQRGPVGSTGYVEGGYAASFGRPALSQALIKNRSGVYADPTNAAAVAAGLANVVITKGGSNDGKPLVGETRPDCILFISPATFDNPSSSTAYPIDGLSYLLFYGKGNAATGHLANLRTLESYIGSGHVGNAPFGSEYAPLPAAIRANITAAANGTGAYAGKACIQ